MTWVTPVTAETPGMAGLSPVPVAKPAVAVPDAGNPHGGTETLGFKDLVDVLNPLQHIPVVSEIYRAISGDRISESARYCGNALYGLALGGPIGFSVMTGYSIASTAIGEVGGQSGADPQMAAGRIPVRKPKGEVVQPAVAVSGSEDGNFLGAEVARTAEPGTGAPVDLAALLKDVAQAPKPATVQADPKPETAQPPSREDALKKIASHKDNHLPLDVLKALQERHLARANHEST